MIHFFGKYVLWRRPRVQLLHSCFFQFVTTFAFVPNKLSPGGLGQFTLSPISQYDGTQELDLTLLGRVPMPASYTHWTTSLLPTITIIFIYDIYLLSLHTSFLRKLSKLLQGRLPYCT